MRSSNLDLHGNAAPANRRILLLIFAIIMVPFLLAYFMWRTGTWMPEGTTNNGILILPPLSIDKFNLSDLQDTAVDHQTSGGRWSLLILGEGACSSDCENALYLTRQVHIALGKEASRVIRYYVDLSQSADEALSAKLLSEHPRLARLRGDKTKLLNYLQIQNAQQELGFTPQSSIQLNYVFVTDPLGNIMLYFTPDHTGKQILTDLKKLLKNSKIG